MPAIYDNWERLVAAVLNKKQVWQLFHGQSSSSSISSSSSDFSFCRLYSSLDDVPFSFSSPEWAASNQKEDEFGNKATASTHSNILVKDQSSVENFSRNKNVTFAPPRKRDLKIEVPKLRIQDRGFSGAPDSLDYRPSVSPRTTSSSRVVPRGRGGHTKSQTNWADDANRQSHPLPLPPATFSNSSHVSPPNSAVKSPSARLRGLGRAENVKSPGTSWRKGKLIARGPLGGVYLGFDSEKGEMCVMKEVTSVFDDAEPKQIARMLEKEIELLSHIKHPNIVQYYGSETVGDNFYVCLEYVSGGSIYTILQEYGKLGELVIRSYTQQILAGLAHLHSQNIAHRDIKAASVLVNPNGRVKLCNFGIEKRNAGQAHLSFLMDSRYWMAPEVIMKSNAHNLASDIWSLGCTVLEMATARPPISQYNWVMTRLKIANHKELSTFPDHLSDVCKDFLRHCLQWDPLHRATASQLLEHPFVGNPWPLGKQILVSTSSDHPAVKSSVKSEGADHARNYRQLDSGKVASRSSKASKSSLQPSDIYTPRNISAPASPVGRPLPHPRSPQHLNRGTSPPPKSSPPAASTPIIGETGAIPHPHVNQSMLQQETFRNLPKHSSKVSSPSYWDPNILQGIFRFS